MAAILTLLKSLQNDIPPLYQPIEGEHHKRWTFKKALMEKAAPNNTNSSESTDAEHAAFIRPFIYHYEYLQITYAINCGLILKRMQDGNKISYPDPVFESHVKSALALANLLHVINFYYFASPQECRRLEKEEVIFRRILREFDYHFELVPGMEIDEDDTEAHQKKYGSVTKDVRETTGWINWPRLLLVRVKRVLTALVPFFKGMPNFVSAVQFIDSVANPIFTYLAWAFYVPRLTINLFLFLKNVIPHPWMSQRQKNMGMSLRAKCQLRDQWFELANDFIWMLVGLMNCFFLVGSLAPCAIYLTIALYAFDVTLSAIRTYIELSKLYQLKQQLTDLASDTEHSEQVDAYLCVLDSRIQYETARMALSLVTTTGLFVGMLFAIPAFASYPFIPLIGASFIVMLCVSTFAAGKVLDGYKPDSKVLDITTQDLLSILNKGEKPHKLTKSESVFFTLSSTGHPHGAKPQEQDDDESSALTAVSSDGSANSNTDSPQARPTAARHRFLRDIEAGGSLPRRWQTSAQLPSSGHG